MKLRKPCPEHNMYYPHPTFDGKAISLISAQEMANSNQNHRLGDCPGGVFLPDDLFDRLQDQLEDIYCIRLQGLGVHVRGRCQSFAAEAVDVFKVALGETP